MPQTKATPAPILNFYDVPFWRQISEERQFRLQACCECGTVRYPPGPTCFHCLSPDFEWKAMSGRGTILSWVIYHRGYLPEYPAPYNVIAVRLEEGPTIISNLEGPVPEGSWIGKPVRLFLQNMEDGVILPRFTLEDSENP